MHYTYRKGVQGTYLPRRYNFREGAYYSWLTRHVSPTYDHVQASAGPVVHSVQQRMPQAAVPVVGALTILGLSLLQGGGGGPGGNGSGQGNVLPANTIPIEITNRDSAADTDNDNTTGGDDATSEQSAPSSERTARSSATEQAAGQSTPSPSRDPMLSPSSSDSSGGSSGSTAPRPVGGIGGEPPATTDEPVIENPLPEQEPEQPIIEKPTNVIEDIISEPTAPLLQLQSETEEVLQETEEVIEPALDPLIE